jgi:CheY-like chemotaxis protein
MATILIVDDEPSARTTLGLLLKKRSHRVTEVEGVAAALKALTDDAFDVIVTDLRMPDGDGLDVLRAARAHCPDADVILLTAYAAGSRPRKRSSSVPATTSRRGASPTNCSTASTRRSPRRRCGARTQTSAPRCGIATRCRGW